MKVVKSIAANTIALGIEQAFTKGISVLASILLVRYLTPEQLGEFRFVYTYISFFVIFSFLGIDNIIIREASQHKDRSGVLIGNGLVLKLIFSVFFILLAWLILNFLRCPVTTKILIYIASFELLLGFKSIYSLVFQIELKNYYHAVIQIFSGLFDAALTIFLIYLGGALIHFILIGICVALFELVANRIFSNKFIKPVFKIDFSIWRYLLKEGWPLGLTYFFVSIYFRIDQIMIHQMAGVAQLAGYSVAVMITDFFHILSDSFMISVFPVMAAQCVNCQDSFRKVYFLSAKYLLIVVWPIATFVSFYARQILFLLFGEKYLSSSQVLIVLSWSLVFVFSGALITQILTSIGKQKINALITFLTSILNIALNIFFIPRWGIFGAALATVISYAAATGLVYCIPYLRTYVLVQMRVSVKPVFCSFVMLAFLFFLAEGNMVFGIVLAPVVFLVSMIFIGGVDKTDYEQLKKVFAPNRQ